jgi:hypothetical protein
MSVHPDTRLNLRSTAHGHAVIPFQSAMIPAEVVNVSLGGALLQTQRRTGLPSKGTRLDAELRLAGSERWFEVPARVTRTDLLHSTLALEFIDVDRELEDAIADVVLEGIDAAERPRVLLVDLDPGRRSRLARLLRMTGCSPVEAGSPLEIIRACEEANIPIAGAAVVDHETKDFDELAAFLRRTYAGIEVVRIDWSSARILDELRLLARAVRQH